MSVDFKAAYRYANAFFVMSKREDGVREVYSELIAVRDFLKQYKELPRLLLNVTIAYSEKEELISNLLGFVSKQTQDFIKLLARKGRFEQFEQILKDFNDLYNADQGIEEVRFVTPYPIDETVEQKLCSILEKKLNKKILLKTEVDSALIGGAIVYTKNQVIDGSLRDKLKVLKQSLMSGGGLHA